MANKKHTFSPSIEQLTTTNKVYKLRQEAKDDNELADLIDLSKVTMYTRFRISNWKKSEMFYIDHLSNPE